MPLGLYDEARERILDKLMYAALKSRNGSPLRFGGRWEKDLVRQRVAAVVNELSNEDYISKILETGNLEYQANAEAALWREIDRRARGSGMNLDTTQQNSSALATLPSSLLVGQLLTDEYAVEYADFFDPFEKFVCGRDEGMCLDAPFFVSIASTATRKVYFRQDFLQWLDNEADGWAVSHRTTRWEVDRYRTRKHYPVVVFAQEVDLLAFQLVKDRFGLQGEEMLEQEWAE